MDIQPSSRRRCSGSKALKKLGVTADDVHLAEKLLEQIPSCPCDPNKAERILGYASSYLARGKALRLLGTSEEEVALENAKNLGALGVGGRRRSFIVLEEPNPILLRRRRHTVQSVQKEKKKRGLNSKKEIKLLRNQAKSSANEIDQLKARIDELEKRLATTEVAQVARDK